MHITSQVESSTEPGHMNWKVRGLLESSTADSASDVMGILSESYRLKIPRYGGTTTEMKVASSLSLSHYGSCREGPLPYWGGRNLRDNEAGEKDHRGNSNHRTTAHVEMETGSVCLSQSVPNYGSEKGLVREERGGGEGRREGEPEGKEERNYSRMAGVGEEGDEREEKEVKKEMLRSVPKRRRRSSESSLELQRSRGEVSPANRKHRRRRRRRSDRTSRRKSSRSLIEGGREEEEEEEEGFRMSSEELVIEKLVPVRERERGGGGGFS